MWIEVTNDEYELPVAVAETAHELAKILGVNVCAIYSSKSHFMRGVIKKPRYLKIEEEKEETGMTEYELIENLKMIIKHRGCSIEHVAKQTGYLAETIRHWFSGKTHITVDGLCCICKAIDRKPMIRDANGKYHEDILKTLGSIVKEHEEEVYALFENKKYAKQNIKKWVSGEHGMRLMSLIPILNAVGAEIVLFYDFQN